MEKGEAPISLRVTCRKKKGKGQKDKEKKGGGEAAPHKVRGPVNGRKGSDSHPLTRPGKEERKKKRKRGKL